MGLLERLRAQPGWKDPDPKARRAAVRTLTDPALLAEVARTDPDDVVRDEATETLLDLALKGTDEPAGQAALAALGDPKHLVTIARSAALEALSRAALGRLDDPKALGSVARHGEHAATRLEALARLADAGELAAVALKSPHKDAALAALDQVTAYSEILEEAARHARSPAAAHRARAILHERAEAAARASAAPALKDANRRAQVRLCGEVEALARSGDCEPLAARLDAARNAWTDLLPNVDDDLHERFTAAVREARARLARNQAERAERERRAQAERALRDAHLVPRLALCGAVERAEGDDAPRALDDSLWEWERLPPVDVAEPAIVAEAAVLARRFEEACATCRERHARWEREQAEAARSAQEEAARAERARLRAEREARERENLTRLQALCARAERLVQAETPTLKKADPALREIRAALDDPGPLPSRRQHHALVELLKAAQTALAPKVKELREADGWKRWANANVQEELCARVEALREFADPLEASRQARDLMERWKGASAVSKGKAQGLWIRFKTAQDEVRARLDAHQAEQAARKQALCDQAETLAASTEWAKAGEAIKGLQAAWKTIGPATRGQEKALWERFRKACDQFFTRRDEDLGRRKEEWKKNQERKEALIARAEELAGSTDWKATAEEVKRLQAEWKTIGPARKTRAEALWRRFRAACDRFFERYKRRDQIEMEVTLATREVLLREIEALVPAAAPALPPALDPAPPAEAAARPPDAAAPPDASAVVPPADRFKALQAARRRWLEMAPLARAQAAPLEERLDAALARFITAFPELVKGTDLDFEQNRRRMEDLCERVERLLPSSAGATDETGISPVARLAAHWREALASNTIGGKAAEEAKWRAAADEAQKARLAWKRVGYVPDAPRRDLSERFERACRRLPEPKSGERGARTRAPSAARRSGRP